MSRCRSCDARIEWAKTTNGRNIPLDFDHVPDGNLVIVNGEAMGLERAAGILGARKADELPRRRSHFATCPQAADHRRRPS